jgi:hypothetical protein
MKGRLDFIFVLILIVGLALLGLLLINGKSSVQVDQPIRSQKIKVEKLGNCLSDGIHHVTLNDSVTIIVYRYHESVSMIQIK